MRDSKKTKAQLIAELEEARQRIAKLSAGAASPEPALSLPGNEEDLFFSVFERHAAAMLLIDTHSRMIVDANPAAVTFYGYPREVFPSLHIGKINMLPEEELSRKLRKTLALEENYFTFPHRLASGERRWVEVHSTPLTCRGRDLLLSIVHDATERMESEKALRYSEAIKQAVLDSSLSFIIVKDHEGRFTLVNKAFAQYIGVDADSLIGKTDFDIFPPELAERFRQEDLGIIEKQEPLITEDKVSIDGQERYFLGIRTPFCENETGISGVCVITSDITQRKRVEKALHDSEIRFDLAMNATRDGVFDWNLVTNEMYYSPGWKSMLGYNYDELPNDFSVWQTLTDPEDVKRSWEMQQELITKQRDRFELEFKMKHKDGHWVDILARATAVFDEKGNAVRIVGTHVDITERKQAAELLSKSESRLREAQKLARVGSWEYDLRTGKIWGSDEGFQVYGMTPPPSNLLPIDEIEACIPERERVRQALVDLINSDKPYDLEFDILPADGSPRKTLISKAKLERNTKGEPVSIAGVIQDITDRKQVEEALTERVKELQGLYSLGKLTDDEDDLERLFERFVNDVVPPSMQFPDHVVAAVEVDGISHANKPIDPPTFLTAPILTYGMERGYIIVGYDTDIGFIPDYEQRLVDAYAERLGHVIERVETHKDLDKSQTILAEAEKLAALGGWEWSLARNTVHVSKNWLAIHGCDDPILTVEELLPIAHPEDQPAIGEAWARAVQNGDEYDIEHRIIRQDTGEVRQIKALGKPIFGESGKVVQMYGVALDITERKANEAALKRIEWLLSKKPLQDRSGYTPPYGDVTSLNTCRTILDSVGPQMLAVLARQTIELLDTSVAIYEQNGDYAFGKFSSGWCQFMDKVSRDLCGDVDNQEALTCGKWLCHENCWNDSAKTAMESGQPTDIECVGGIHLYGVPIMVDGEAIGAINIGYGNPPRDEETLQELAAQFNVSIADLRKRAEKYESRPAYIMELAKKNLHGTAQLIGEIISRRKMEEELREARVAAEVASRTKSEFLANMSHEIRTPLNGVMGMLQLLNASGLEAELKEYANIALESSRNLLKIINDILDFSKIEAGKIDLHHEPFEIDSLLRSLVLIFSTQTKCKEITLDYRISLDTPNSVVGDMSRLRQVLFNLVGNAVKFTDKGRVRIEVRPLGKTSPHHLRLGISISDTGIGIPQDKIEYLFEPFTQVDGSHTRRFSGTGLGLSIVKRLVGLMEGSIDIESIPGQGTTVRFDILVETREFDDAPKPLEESAITEHCQRSLSILVAEDDRVSALLIKRILVNWGHNVILVQDGSEALEAVLNNDIDLMLMDIQMPEMDGVQATSIIRKDTDYAEKSSVPIIALTAHALKGEQEQFLEAGMNGYVAKPVEMEELQQEMNRVLVSGEKAS